MYLAISTGVPITVAASVRIKRSPNRPFNGDGVSSGTTKAATIHVLIFIRLRVTTPAE